MKLKQLMKARNIVVDSTRHKVRTDQGEEVQIEPSADNDRNGDKTESNRMLEPTLRDVLCGRGKPFQDHPGNLRLHKIVNRHQEKYLSSRRYNKLAITEDIVEEIKKPGNGEAARFLKRSEDMSCWLEVSDDIAREKVSHALRGKPRRRDILCPDAESGPSGVKGQIERTDLSESKMKKQKFAENQDDSASTKTPSFLRAHQVMARPHVLDLPTSLAFGSFPNQALSSPTTINPLLAAITGPNSNEASPFYYELARAQIYARERTALTVYLRERAAALESIMTIESSDGSLQGSQIFRPQFY
jgi:hypothetical protein